MEIYAPRSKGNTLTSIYGIICTLMLSLFYKPTFRDCEDAVSWVRVSLRKSFLVLKRAELEDFVIKMQREILAKELPEPGSTELTWSKEHRTQWNLHLEKSEAGKGLLQELLRSLFALRFYNFVTLSPTLCARLLFYVLTKYDFL